MIIFLSLSQLTNASVYFFSLNVVISSIFPHLKTVKYVTFKAHKWINQDSEHPFHHGDKRENLFCWEVKNWRESYYLSFEFINSCILCMLVSCGRGFDIRLYCSIFICSSLFYFLYLEMLSGVWNLCLNWWSQHCT